MANEEQLSILKQGVDTWNKWIRENHTVSVDLREADLNRADLRGAKLTGASLVEANLVEANITQANLINANLRDAYLMEAVLPNAYLNLATLRGSNLTRADLIGADLTGADLTEADLTEAHLGYADLSGINLSGTKLPNTIFSGAVMASATLANVDLSRAIGLVDVSHEGPSTIGTNTLVLSQGNIPEKFLRGCGLSDWEIESAKLYQPDLKNDEIVKIQYRIYELRATQAIQISPLFISYSHNDSAFVDQLEEKLNAKGIRFWRDIHDMKAGRMEKQIDQAISQNPTVLLILSKHSLESDWVEHEVRTARALEKEMKRDVLCPVALDDGWKNSPWAKRIMEQIMEYNILDFSKWKDEATVESTFNKLIDGLELFYK